MIRTLVPIAAVLGLLQMADRADLLSGFTRFVIVRILDLAGIPSMDRGADLVVGSSLVVPWTEDCAGLNVLALLWAVVLWINRSRSTLQRLWAPLVLAVPLAFAANVGRVLTVITYRAALYPEVESPQLHYFIGFLWVVPFMGLFLRHENGLRDRVVEAVHLAVTLSLVASLVGGPGGNLVALAALVTLAASHDSSASSHSSGSLMTVAWIGAAVLIASARMESLWIPWLLLCPWHDPSRILRSATRLMLVVGTIPLVAMQPLPGALILLAAAWRVFELRRRDIRPDTAVPPHPESPASSGLINATRAMALALPLWSPLVGQGGSERVLAPPGVMARNIDGATQSLRVLGQSPEIELVWFAPSASGRHHSLPVCMRYRGVTLEATADQGVMTDGDRWMREFFLHDGRILRDYRSYLARTFVPFSASGAHIIASAPVESMSATAFAETVDRLADEIHELDHGGNWRRSGL